MSSNSKARSLLSSAETIGSNQDILTEIFLRLPVTPLVKFKCVSRQWLSIISDPKFCVSHARHQKSHNPGPDALLLYCPDLFTSQFRVISLKDTTHVPFLDFLSDPELKIEKSCNGLLLCSSSLFSDFCGNEEVNKYHLASIQTHFSYEDYDSHSGNLYFICNPTTKQFKRLPFPDYISDGFLPHGAFFTLAFDPLTSPYYKVISLHCLDKRSNFEIDVYSSETESWTQTRIPFPCLRWLNKSRGVFCNGAVHWYSNEKTSPYFVVDDETLRTMPMPPMRNFDDIGYFGESRGHLHLMGLGGMYLSLEFDVWEMASDYSGWSIRYHVDLRSVRSVLPKKSWEERYLFTVFSIIWDAKEEESTIVLFQKGGRVVSYNPCDGTASKLCDLEPRKEFEQYFDDKDVYPYFETLACV